MTGDRMLRARGHRDAVPGIDGADCDGAPGNVDVREHRLAGKSAAGPVSKDPCVCKADGSIKSRMLAAEDAWRADLRQQTLADLLSDGERLIDAEKKAAVEDYVRKAQR